jgi:Cdc6-like AAA superfamily ATPase
MSDELDFDLSDLTEARKETKNPFEVYSLNRNPFPKSAIADEERARAEKFSRCRKNALKKMQSFIKTVYVSRRWSGLILKGEVGSGKSHTLFFVSNEVNRQLSDLERDSALAIYIESPKDSINELFQEIMEKIGRELFEAQSLAVIGEKAKVVLASHAHQQVFQKAEMPEQDPAIKLRKMWKNLNPSSEGKVLDALTKELSNEKVVQHRDFSRCLVTLIMNQDSEKRNAAWRFCTGRTLTKSEARDFGLVSEKLSEDEIIRFVFPSVIQILNKNNVAMLFLFIDELEKMVSLPEKKVKDFLEKIRSLIDNNLNGFSMIFSCQTESWDNLASNSPALSDRMSEIVDLDPLLTSDAVFLMEDYLATARLPSFDGKPLFPFSEAAVDKINQSSKGSIRYILQNCHTILEFAASSTDTGKLISPQFVEKVLQG